MNSFDKPSKRSTIKRFFSGLNSVLTSIRIFVFNIVFVGILIAITISLVQTPIEINTLTKPGALLLAPQGRLVDQLSYQSPAEQIQSAGTINETLTLDLIKALKKAEKDPMINSLIINTNRMSPSSLSKIAEVGQAIKSFQRSKKPVIAVGSGFSQSQYLLASYADEIWMHPMGAIELIGVGYYSNYLKDGFDKLGIEFKVFRAGDYKSATDVLTETAMPELNKNHNQGLIDSIWTTYQQVVLDNRTIDIDDLVQYTHRPDELLAESNDFAQIALDLKLIDFIVTSDQAEERLQMIAGVTVNLKDNAAFNHINTSEYIGFSLPSEADIGLLVLSGQIHSGGREFGGISSQVVVDLIKQTREDKNIKALVVRVDSPGGSAYASEAIRRQLELLSDEGIPVYISMGSVAASGGYWIATSGKKIWADPATITGSIGVFGVLPNIKQSFDKIGVNNDGVGTTPLSDAYAIERPFNPLLGTMLQSGVDFIYNQFLNLVAHQRNMEVDEVDAIAGGRVWSGQQALELGLVDELGNLQKTLSAVAKDLDIDSTKWQLIRPEPTFLEMIMEEFSQELIQASWVRSIAAQWQVNNPALGIMSQWLQEFNDSVIGQIFAMPSDPKNQYLICETCRINFLTDDNPIRHP